MTSEVCFTILGKQKLHNSKLSVWGFLWVVVSPLHELWSVKLLDSFGSGCLFFSIYWAGFHSLVGHSWDFGTSTLWICVMVLTDLFVPLGAKLMQQRERWTVQGDDGDQCRSKARKHSKDSKGGKKLRLADHFFHLPIIGLMRQC